MSSISLTDDEKITIEWDLYQIMGCEPTATIAELRKGHKKQALRWHPDKWITATEQEKKIAAMHYEKLGKAWEFLQKDDRRKEYDNRAMSRAERKRKLAAEDDLTRKLKEDLERRENNAKRGIQEKKRRTEEESSRAASADIIAQMRRAGQLARRTASAVSAFKTNKPSTNGVDDQPSSNNDTSSSDDTATNTSTRKDEDDGATLKVKWDKRKSSDTTDEPTAEWFKKSFGGSDDANAQLSDVRMVGKRSALLLYRSARAAIAALDYAKKWSHLSISLASELSSSSASTTPTSSTATASTPSRTSSNIGSTSSIPPTTNRQSSFPGLSGRTSSTTTPMFYTSAPTGNNGNGIGTGARSASGAAAFFTRAGSSMGSHNASARTSASSVSSSTDDDYEAQTLARLASLTKRAAPIPTPTPSPPTTTEQTAS